MKTKNVGWLGLAALLAISPIRGHAQMPGAPPDAAATAQVNLSPGAAEVVKLAQSGLSDDVTLAYIQNSQSAFALSSDSVVYLKDLGLSPAVITAMLNHDGSLNHQPQYTYDQKLYPSTGPVPAPEPVAAPAAPQVATDQPPVAAPDQSAPPPVYDSNPPVDVNYFYNDLSPYGSWVNLPGYGWCWQPSAVVINRGWRPYCDGGHWVYSDAGWFWQSDYSWGWAPFHYGRWRMDERCGWVWFPDRVWGPAWVSWRSSGDHCGWAPLPLHADFDVGGGFRFNGVRVGVDFDFGLGVNLFTFVSLRDFHDHDLGHRRLPPTEVTKIYNRTTIINNYTVENKIIVNRGIDARRVEEATHVPERKIALRDVRAGEQMPRDGTPAVYRHELGAPVRSGPVVAQRVDERHPVIQHNALAAVRVEPRVAPVNTLQQPAQVTPQRLQQQRELPQRDMHTVPQPQPAQVRPQTLQQQREVPQRDNRSIAQPQPQPQPGNQRYTPPNQNQSSPQNQEHRTGNSIGATFPNAAPPNQPMQHVVPEQHYAPTPNAVQRQPVAPQTHIEQPNLVTHDYVPRSRQATEAHALQPVNQPAPAYHSAPAPVQSAPHNQQGYGGGNGSSGGGGGNSHNGGGNANSGGNGGGNGNNGGNNNSPGGRNDRGGR